jgi:glycosyltransferase involved in cell wall biosynthesis
MSGGMDESRRQQVAIIIPAKDEEARILRVLKAACQSKLASEVIVVSDGSCDRTADVARSVEGVKVIELPVNRGKAGAMAAGVKATSAPILAFVDADLAGLTGDHIDKIIRPLLSGQCEMCVGIFRGGRVWSDHAQKIAPYLSGQRALKRELFEAVPRIGEQGMGVEVALNDAAKRRKARVIRVVLHGVSNCFKEQKLGIVKGTAARTKMYLEIATTVMRNKKMSRKKITSTRRPWL